MKARMRLRNRCLNEAGGMIRRLMRALSDDGNGGELLHARCASTPAGDNRQPNPPILEKHLELKTCFLTQPVEEMKQQQRRASPAGVVPNK